MQFRENLCKNTTFFFTIILILFLLNATNSFCKDIGAPYIQRIALNNYGINNNNFKIFQDNNDILYIENSNGILKYNGNSWDLFKISGKFCFTIGSDGLIYIGSKNKFGYIKSTQNKNEFISLLDSGSINKFGQVEQIISLNNSIYFSTSNALYKWNGSSVQVILQFDSKFELHKVKNAIYIESLNNGLQKLIDDDLLNLPNSNFFINRDILSILPFNEQLLIKTKRNPSFFIFDNNTCSEFKTEADNFITEGNFVHACEISNGNIAIGTELKGIVIINKDGDIQSFIDENSGLFSLSVNYLYTDKSNNLWTLHNHGISRIELPSPYRYFYRNQGLKGSVSSVIRYNNILYVATSQGVFYLKESKNAPSYFYPINKINAKCFEFHVSNNELYILSSKGIYSIKDKKAMIFFNRNAEEITCVWHSKKNPEYFYLGQSNGFSKIRFTNEIFIIQDKFSYINETVTSIAEDSTGNLWLVANYNKLWQVNPSNTNIQALRISEQNELPNNIDWINLNALESDVLFSTSNGVYKFDYDTQKFISKNITQTVKKVQNQWIYPIAEDENKNLWINIIGQNDSKNTTLVRYKNKNSIESLNPLPLNRIKDFFITSILPDNNQIVWFGGFDGLIRLDLNKKKETINPVKVFLNRIILDNDSIIYSSPFGANYSLKKLLPFIITYDLNSVRFIFSANDYSSEEQILYQHRLLGFDSSWSNWTNSNLKEYTNLFEGEYRFELKAKNIINQESEIESFSFKVKSPVYRSTIAFILYIVILTLIFVLIGKWRAYYFAHERFRLENIIHERTEEVVIQKEKADNLLERVLPKNTAKELKSGRKAGPYHYNMVTVLFSDIQGFTKISEQMESEMLIDELDKFFLQFDTVVEKYNIEKIKTIGDAYMCAGGIPIKNRTNPVEVVLAAFEMQNFMKGLKSTADDSTKHIWDLRIGVDTGPVIAGVLGKSKISYDIWGGTVNTASRMEASSESGKINITENTYMLIKDFFICQYRGKMPVKYKGEIDMYFVEGFKPELSSDLKRQLPNEKFFTQLQLLRVNDVEEFVLSKLEDGLPDNLYYHNVKHTIDVVTQVELIGRSEGISDLDILVLKTAALFHDMGHLVNYDTHEEESVKLAKKILPEYKYTTSQIEQICRLIMVTHMPPQPKNLLEEIMCDADLDYLGRTDFVPVSINLYKELAERNKIDSILEWNKMQLNFIKNHHYFTKTAQNLREVNKKNQLQNIQEEIKREIEQHDE
jgi:class 3 adenylate cyclase/ligand-binding sensor domain-containing protein